LKYSHIVRALETETWAITEQGLAVIQGIVEERLAGHKPTLAEVEARIDGKTYGSPELLGQQGSIAVIGLYGTILNRAGGFDAISGASSPQKFARAVRAAADDPNVRELVIDIDSPGGTVSGTFTAADAVAYASARKPVTAVANEMAASAAYWIASQATRLVVPPSGVIGSISVISTHYDWSARFAMEGVKPTILRTGANKALGQREEAMSGPGLENRMRDMQKFHDQFVTAVARGRHRPPERVQAEWADGRIFIGQEAVDAGLADEVGTLAGILERLTPGAGAIARANPNADAEARAMAAIAGLPLHDEDGEEPEDREPTDEDNASTTSETPAGAQEPAPQPSAPTQEGETGVKDLNAVLDGLPAEQRAVVEQALAEERARAEEAAAREAAATEAAKTERETRLNREFSEKATALGLAADFGSTLRAMSEKLDEAEYAAAVEALQARALAKEETETLTQEIGSAARNPAGSAYERAEAIARGLMASDAKLTLATALDRAFRDNPELAREYHEEGKAK
jgi:signal peptide peptidase SppA